MITHLTADTLLSALAITTGDRAVIAKLDVDAAPEAAARFTGIQSATTLAAALQAAA